MRPTCLVPVTLGAGLLLALSGCASQDPMVSSGQMRPEPPMLGPAERPAAPAGASENVPIDLTDPAAFAVGTAEATIIDTRTFEPQVQASFPFEGPTRRVKEVLPPHTRRPLPQGGEPNDLPVGGTLAAVRARPGPRFPGIAQTPWTPPDPTIAVGPNHIVATVNMAVAFYGKDGSLQFSANLDSTGSPGFFEDVGAGTFTFDPKCFYDHHAGRFVIVALEVYGSTQSWIDIAVSDDSDPHGVWYKYRTNSVVSVGSSRYWVDYPGFGFDETGYYVTGNLFGLNVGGFGGVLFRCFEKQTLLSGGTAVWRDLRDPDGASVQAGQHFGEPPAPYFVSVGGNTSLRIQAIENPHTSPVLRTTTVAVPGFLNPPGSVPTRGGGSLDTIDARLFNVHWRDGELYTGHNISAGGRGQARWYHLRTNNWPASGSVSFVQSGNIDGGPGVHTFFPAIYSNHLGQVGLVVGATSSSTFASVNVTGRLPSDPPGTMGAIQQVAIGSANITVNDNRWGDYFDIAVDPTNDRVFWVVGEYQDSGGWRTWISSFELTAPCAPDFDGDGELTSADFAAYRAAFLAGSDLADFDADGELTPADFVAYRAAFLAGCP